jgi:hypothetical protein
MVEDLNDLAGKTALRKLRRALHEQDDVVALHLVVDELADAHGWPLDPVRERRGAARTMPIYVTQDGLSPQMRRRQGCHPCFKGA